MKFLVLLLITTLGALAQTNVPKVFYFDVAPATEFSITLKVRGASNITIGVTGNYNVSGTNPPPVILTNPPPVIIPPPVIVPPVVPTSGPPARVSLNLVPNSGFEIGLQKGWVWYNKLDSAATSRGEPMSQWEAITNDSHSGKSSFRMPEGGHLVSRALWLTQGVYSVSSWIKAGRVAPSDLKWGMVSGDSVGNDLVLSNFPAVDPTWKRFSGSFSPPKKGFYHFQLSWWQNGQLATCPQIDDVQVAPGPLTDWSPSQAVEAGLVITNYGGAYFLENDKELGLRFYNDGPEVTRHYEIRWLDDYNLLTKIAAGPVLVPPGLSTVQFTLPARSGWCRAVSTLDVPDSWDEAGLSVFPFSKTYFPKLGTNSVWGVHAHTSRYHSRKYSVIAPMTRNLSPARLQMRWVDIEPRDNDWYWSDSEVRNNATNGMTIFGVLTPGTDGTWPTWATNANGTYSITAWTNYAGMVASRYGSKGLGLVKYLEVLNEPHNYKNPEGKFLDPVLYANLLTESVKAIRAADPAMIIIAMGGVSYGTGLSGAEWAKVVWNNISAETKADVGFVAGHIYSGNNDPNLTDTTDDHFVKFGQWRTGWSGIRPYLLTESAVWGFGGMRGLNALWHGTYNLTDNFNPEAGRAAGQDRLRMVDDTCARTILRAIGNGFSQFYYYDSRFFNPNTHRSSEPGGDEFDDSFRPHISIMAIAAWLIDNGYGYGRLTNKFEPKLEGYWFRRRDGGAALAAWSSDMQLRTLTVTNGGFALYDHNGNLLQTNTPTLLLTRTPRVLVSGSLSTNQLRETFEAALVAPAKDTNGPNVSIDIAPTGLFKTGAFSLVKWSAIDNVFVNSVPLAPDKILYQYQIDRQTWSLVTQSNHVWLPNLAEGAHTLMVRAIDTLGNTGSVVHAFPLTK